MILGTIATLLIQSNSFESKKVHFTKIRFYGGRGEGNNIIAAYNILKGAQTEIGLAEIYLSIHTAMNSFIFNK